MHRVRGRGKNLICSNILSSKLDRYNVKLCQQGKDKSKNEKSILWNVQFRRFCERLGRTLLIGLGAKIRGYFYFYISYRKICNVNINKTDLVNLQSFIRHTILSGNILILSEVIIYIFMHTDHTRHHQSLHTHCHNPWYHWWFLLDVALVQGFVKYIPSHKY